MQKIIVLLLATLMVYNVTAQNTLTVVIKDSKTLLPLTGANISFKNSSGGGLTDSNGTAVLTNLPAGKQTLVFSFTGYQTQTRQMNFPLIQDDIIIIELEIAEEEMEEVIIQSTRTTRTIANTPTRVETIDGEELDEKNNMRPANVSMLLHESTGCRCSKHRPPAAMPA